VRVYESELRNHARELDVLVHGEVAKAMMRMCRERRDQANDDDSYLSNHVPTLQRFWRV
jgi:hypothetical protein